MPPPQNAMEIFALLDKSNCRECGEKTCLAFAGAVYQGRRRVRECPRLSRAVAARYANDGAHANALEENREAFLQLLKDQVRDIDLAVAAARTGGRLEGNRLVIKILGKEFSVDSAGRLAADIHVNPWVAIPFLTYVLHTKGLLPTGQWVSLREFVEGRERFPLFQKRCESPMQAVADAYTGLFDDLVHIFNGREVEKQFQSDISVVLDPLPRVPLMICYWRRDEGLASKLHVFFDRTAEVNLDIGSLFSLGAGLAQMFERLALRHGFTESPPA